MTLVFKFKIKLIKKVIIKLDNQINLSRKHEFGMYEGDGWRLVAGLFQIILFIVTLKSNFLFLSFLYSYAVLFLHST